MRCGLRISEQCGLAEGSLLLWVIVQFGLRAYSAVRAERFIVWAEGLYRSSMRSEFGKINMQSMISEKYTSIYNELSR